MSTFSSSSRNKADREGAGFAPRILAAPLEQVAETLGQVRQRVGAALTRVCAWWDQRSIRATAAALPGEPRAAVVALRSEEAVLGRRSQTLRATEQTHQQEAHHAAEQRDELEHREAAELARLAEFMAAANARAAAERQVAAQVTAAASVTVAVADADVAAAAHAVSVAEAASAPGRARVSRVEKQAAKDKTPAQAAATKASAASRTKEICEEATYPIPWVAESEIAGVRMSPPGMYAQSVAMVAPHSRVVGAMGYFDAQVDWAHPTAATLATAIFCSQVIASSKRGGQVKHVAHAVLSKPNDGRQAVQRWTPDTAMRATRHYLVGHGADPDRHDVVVFIHSQVVKRANGSTKVEEAVHILWSRVRDDGALHDLDHAFIADAVGRARYDVYAGIDPARIGMASTESYSVRAGLTALKKRELAARYVDPRTMRLIESVPLQGRAHAERLSAEGRPEPGDIAGTWTTKPCYRTEKSIRDILNHLMAGD